MVESSWEAKGSPLNFTKAAAQKVGQLIEAEGNADLKLRVYIFNQKSNTQ